MDANNANLQNFEGLNYIHDFSIWCHYEMENGSLIWSYIKKYKKSVIALPEDTGIFYSKSGIEVRGNSPSFVFKDDDKILVQPNHLFNSLFSDRCYPLNNWIPFSCVTIMTG